MSMDYKLVQRFFEGKTTPEETIMVMAAIAVNPELKEFYVTQKRLAYANEQLEDYGSFIPASSLAADDGRNLCDLQCEAFILQKAGIATSEEDLARESKSNYWLRSQGTPLFNMGKLLESKGFLVNRVYNASIDVLEKMLKRHSVIVVVNGDTLESNCQDILSEDFSLDNNPNHAVVVLGIDKGNGQISLYNPAKADGVILYDLSIFNNAWEESQHYMVTVRKRKKNEYIPQPIDTSNVNISPELQELIEMVCENTHDEWAIGKLAKAKVDGRVLKYGRVDGDRETKSGKKMRYSHYFVPYSSLSEEDKEPDRRMVLSTIKLLKRLGYRLVNINSMFRCPDCGEVIEPSNNFCPNCGRQLTWEDFR